MAGNGDREERRRLLVARLVELRSERPLSREEGRRAAIALDVAERTVWRWVAAGGYQPRRRASAR